MPAGFQLTKTDTGTVQIDQDYSNFALREKGVFQTNVVVPNWSSLYEGWVTVPSTTGVIAFRATGAPVNLTRAEEIGGTQTRYYFQSSANITVEYWYFDEPKYGQLFDVANCGLLIFKANGELAFDSRMKYMQFLDLFMTNGSGNDSIPTKPYPEGVLPAVVQSAFSGSYALMPLPQDQNLYIGMMSKSAIRFDGRTFIPDGIGSVTPTQDLGPDQGRQFEHYQEIYTVINVAGL